MSIIDDIENGIQDEVETFIHAVFQSFFNDHGISTEIEIKFDPDNGGYGTAHDYNCKVYLHGASYSLAYQLLRTKEHTLYTLFAKNLEHNCSSVEDASDCYFDDITEINEGTCVDFMIQVIFYNP